jgi:hypothetical protein
MHQLPFLHAQPTSTVLYANRSAALLKAGRIEEAIADGLKATQVSEV